MSEFKNKRSIIIGFLLILLVAGWLSGCGAAVKEEAPKELLIYCGTTMIKPMSEIARIIEEQENCKITITKGGSGNLLDSIKVNQVGDLFLPGSDSYITTATEEDLVSETVLVGYNKAAMMVQVRNPKNITADLNNLASPDYYVVIGNPNSGSIGRETQKILEKKGIFEAVQANARQLTTDSKDLALVLNNKEADLVINWYAVSTWPENEGQIDALPIDEEFASTKKLVLGLLKTSKHPDIARKFMEYAASEEGQEIFNKYGLDDVE